ncbi:hypothetical protein J5J01_00325 [Streptomyces fradiae]|uniref:hypothetical protein n=1 Tax=Streptomyces fradiae TaxID=1906 RepID=UPI002019B029|nr:hypothetical protein [Streptomyces fradiae]UQS30285.1 hypothetical protein J5J01_00325 [Streptomyces fradiae]
MDERVPQVTAALAEAGWHQRNDTRWTTWTAPDRSYGLQLDTHAAAHPEQALRSWTAWRLATTDQPPWTIGLSANAPLDILKDLAFSLSLATSPTLTGGRPTASAVAPTSPQAGTGNSARKATPHT